MTNTTFRSDSMSLMGFPSTAIRSAANPGAILPILSARPSADAASDVIDVMAAIAGCPPVVTR